MNGPFLVERAIFCLSYLLQRPCLLLRPLLAFTTNDERVGPLVVARLVAARRLAPWRHRMPGARGLALAAAVRVIDRVHGHAAVGGADALPAVASRLADGYVLVVRIAHLPDRCHALDQHAPRLAGRQLQQSVVTFLRNKLCLSASRAHHLRALARPQFDIVHRGAGGNALERQRVADQDVRIRTAHYRLANLQTYRLDDVALLAIRIVDQRNTRRAIGIVFDRRHFARHAKLLAFEIDQAQLLLVPAAVVPHGHITGVAATARALLGDQQRLVRLVGRDVVVYQRRLEPQRRGGRSKCLNRHRLSSLLPAAFPSPLAIALYFASTTFLVTPLATDCSHSPASSRRPSGAH